MTRSCHRILLLFWALTGVVSVRAEGLHVIELFTSQGCYSCPPADDYLADLIAGDESIVALEFHVDYWDDLVYGAAGQWKDPFSSNEYTQRQRQYNNGQLGGRPGVYTPQIIVDGRYAAVGSDRARVGRQLRNTQAPKTVALSMQRSSDGAMQLTGNNPDGEATTLWLVTYDLKHETQVTAGENKDVFLVNHHVVKAVEPLKRFDRGDRGEFSLELALQLADGEGCSVIAQPERTGPIHGAANCPRS